MSAIQFNKCAINMGKVLKMLENIEPQINNSYDLISQKEDLLVIAYICRVGIIDKIIRYPNWINNNWTIRIPTGLISYKVRKMDEAVEMTIGKLQKLTAINDDINNIIESILLRGEAFHEIEEILPFNFKHELNE